MASFFSGLSSTVVEYSNKSYKRISGATIQLDEESSQNTLGKRSSNFLKLIKIQIAEKERLSVFSSLMGEGSMR